MHPLEQHITGLILPVVEELNLELIRVRITGARTKTLQIMAERPDGTMTAEDCAKLSRALSPVFEEKDPIEDNYNLEISSPGIDRPLTREKDFVNWEGYEARLELDRMIEGRKKFRGILAGYDKGHVAFDIEGESETAMFPREWIVSAKLMMNDALLQESLKSAKVEKSADTEKRDDV